MKKLIPMVMCVLALWTTGVGRAVAATSYETGYPNVARLSGDLFKALEPEQRRALHPVPILVENKGPYLQPSKHFNGSNMVSAVYISNGFIDLVNCLSHAMAINNSQHGYLKQYLQKLAQSEAAVEVQQVANRTDAADINNYQVSNFNQISASLVAMDMAHHYLGHYRKYADRLGEKQQIPINTVVTPEEWRKAVLYGAQNALACGFGVEGMQYFLQSMNDMPARPTWAGYFMPEKVNVKKLSRDLTRLQDCFFAGEKFKF